MKRKLLSGALALVMLAGCTAPVPDTQKLPDDGGEETRVAYVPLDDRPVNTDRVEYLAGSLGYELVMPDAETYRTRLDERRRGVVQIVHPFSPSYSMRQGTIPSTRSRASASPVCRASMRTAQPQDSVRV